MQHPSKMWVGGSNPSWDVVYFIMLMSTDGYISGDRMWAAVPWYGKRYVSIYNGEQICTHNSLETAKKFIQKEIRKK